MYKNYFIALMGVLTVGCASSNLNNCNSIYGQAEYANFINKCSKFQDSETNYKFFIIYSKGLSVSVDTQLANYYLQQSAQQGYSLAQTTLCGGYLDGFNGITDYERAIYWCNRAIQGGSAEAKSLLGKAFFLKSEYKRSIPLLAQNAVNGYAEYQYMLGVSMIKNGSDQNIAYDWLRKSYIQKYPSALTYVSHMPETNKYGLINLYFDSDISYNDAIGVMSFQDKNYLKALKYLQPRANRGFASYQYMLAISMKNLKMPNAEWMYWLRKAYTQKQTLALEFVSNLNNKYGECNFEDAYFKSSATYDEAIQTCKEVNNGSITSSALILKMKKAWRSF